MSKPSFALAVGLLGLTAMPASAATQVEFLVPAYFYPSFLGSDWERLTTAAAQGISVTAIMNPASGPGTASNSDYVAAISAFRAAGGRVLGYVPSGYIGRASNSGSSCQPASGSNYAVSDIVECAARYNTYYQVDGIFVDEMGYPVGGASEAELLSFYTAVYDGIDAINSSWTIFGNPGVNPPEGLLRNGSSGGADSIVTFENYASAFPGDAPPAWARSYPADRFANILIETDPEFDFASILPTLVERNVRYIYATDDQLPNPYDRLPSDWKSQVAAVRNFAAVPEPQTWLMLILGFGLVGSAKRGRVRANAAYGNIVPAKRGRA